MVFNLSTVMVSKEFEVIDPFEYNDLYHLLIFLLDSLFVELNLFI